MSVWHQDLDLSITLEGDEEEEDRTADRRGHLRMASLAPSHARGVSLGSVQSVIDFDEEWERRREEERREERRKEDERRDDELLVKKQVGATPRADTHAARCVAHSEQARSKTNTKNILHTPILTPGSLPVVLRWRKPRRSTTGSPVM